MKDIIIDLMENKVDRRYVKELVTLNEYNRSILIDELEVILNTEKKTIKFDIKNLNEKYDNIINIDENKYVTLLKSSVIIKDIILDIYKNTISYHLIMNAYYNKKVLPYKFVDDHFISYNQLRRYLCYINSVLEAYHIKISSNCLEMIGNESEIQLFYLHYFSYSDIYLVSTNVTIGNDFLKEIMNELVIIGLLSLSVDFYNYAIQIKILLERLIVNKKPIFDSKLIKLTKKRNSYINLTTAIKRAWQKKLTNIIDYNELDDHVLMNFYFILLNSINYTFDTNNQKLKIRNDENIDTLTKFSNLSAPIVKKLLKDTNISNLNKLLVTYLINIYSLSKLTSLYQIRDSRIKKAVIKHYSYSYEIWLNGLEEFVLNNEEINFVYLEDIAVVLTLITNHYLKLSQKNKYNILIVLSGEPSLFVYLLEFFQPFFNSGLNISVIYDQCLTKEIIKQFDANVIATNFNIPNIDQFDKKIKIFRLSYIPYQKEINEIYQYINSN